MPVTKYHEVIQKFDLEKIISGIDLQLTKSGDIALTRDGDLQMGNTKQNATFRMVERWRKSESTINHLFGVMQDSYKKYHELVDGRKLDNGTLLLSNPNKYHEETESIIENKLVASTLSGSIFVVLDGLLIRFKKDLNADELKWSSAPPLINGISFGVLCSAAAANFRHYDEWASVKVPTDQQSKSMNVLCTALSLSVFDSHSYPTIRHNVCDQVMEKITNSSVDYLHEITFQFVKALAK